MSGPLPPTPPAPRAATVVVGFRPKLCGQRHVQAVRAAPEGAGTRAMAPREPLAAVERVPRVARVLALAHRWKGLIDEGVVRDHVALARLVGVSRARITQVMDLLRLAPDIQAAVLDKPRVETRRETIREVGLRRIAAKIWWVEQRHAWARIHRGKPLSASESPDHDTAPASSALPSRS